MVQCDVPTCKNYNEKTKALKTRIIYHKVPSSKQMAIQWLRACSKMDSPIPNHMRVCSDHFSESCYQRDMQHELLGLPLRRRLKRTAVPDMNLPHQLAAKGSDAKAPPNPEGDGQERPGEGQRQPEGCQVEAHAEQQFGNPVLKEIQKNNYQAPLQTARRSFRLAIKKRLRTLANRPRKVETETCDKLSKKGEFLAGLHLKRIERKENIINIPTRISQHGKLKSLNKMQIMEDVREGCDANPPSSPGHADQREETPANDQPDAPKPEAPKPEVPKPEVVEENGGVDEPEAKDAIQTAADSAETEEEEEQPKRTVEESQEEVREDKQEENSNESSTSDSASNGNVKRQLDNTDPNPGKRLKTDLEDNFLVRDKIMNEVIDVADCQNNLEQIQMCSEQISAEIKTLTDMAKEKELEWNRILHMKKFKEELLIRLQRRSQMLLMNETDLNESSDTNGSTNCQQQNVLKCTQKKTMLRELRAANLEKLKQRNLMLQTSFKQKPMRDVQSIIADFRQKHPGNVPRRGRRIRHCQIDNSNSLMNFSSDLNGQRLGAPDGTADSGVSFNGEDSRSSPHLLWCRSSDESKSYKDILMQFSKLSQTEKNELQMHLQSATVQKPPPPYPEVTVHPVTSTSSVAPTNSLLHGILTKAPLKQSSSNGSSPTASLNGGKTFSPTLAKLLTAPEKNAANHVTSTPNILANSLLNPANLSLSDIFSGSKARNEITITPVGNQYESTVKRESIDEENEDQADRLIIDETMDSTSSRTKDDNRSEDGDEVPQCQGCNENPAQFVCAGCGNQWYCSKDCQVSAWEEHSEVCSG